MPISRRPYGPAGLRLLASTAVGGGAYAVYLMACHTNLGPPMSLVPPAQLNGLVQSAYSQQFSATGGATPYVFGLVSGVLPPGLTFSPNGLLFGMPTTAGVYHPLLGVRDRANHFKVDTAVITIALGITPAALPSGTSGSPYSVQLAAAGGTTPYNWTLKSGSLPAGLGLSSSGLVSGTPVASGSFAVTVQATDASADTGQMAYTLTIAQGSCTITPATLPTATLGQTYSVALVASPACNSVAPLTHSQWVVVGSLPNGFTLSPLTGSDTTTLSSTSLVQGTAGAYNFSINFQGIDNGPPPSGQNTTQAYTLTISP